jgi:proline dehydrogenase
VRALVLRMAREPRVRDFLTDGPGRSLARRFVAGETLEEAIGVAQALARQGARVSLDYLGEAVHDLQEAEAARSVYEETIDHLRLLDLPITLSLKPSQFGVDVAREQALALLLDVIGRAAKSGIGVRLDMEDSSHTDVTLWLWGELRREFANVGIVLQAALYRTPRDLETVLAEGGSVRLCKGAYLEPATIAYPRKADVDAAYAQLLDRLLEHAAVQPPNSYLPTAAIATHDPQLIQRAIVHIHRLGLSPDRYEFQMLYGVRRDLQESLLGRGYPLRIYTPWGPAWYPYLTRRLAERPANLTFMVGAILSEFIARRTSVQPARPVDVVRR